MPTKITDTNVREGLAGSNEKRFQIAPDGTMWVQVVSSGSPPHAKYYKSTNGGQTWTYASSSDHNIGVGASTGVPSFFIDADGYAHVCWVQWETDPQVVRYGRGKPLSGGNWQWSFLTMTPAGGRTGTDSDIIAFRSGSGWVAWVSWDTASSTGGKVTRIAVSSAGALSVTTLQHGPLTGYGADRSFSALEFEHNGDGVTPLASPHLYLVTASQTVSSPVRVHKAVYSGGSWTWQTPISLSGNITMPKSAMATVWDGARLLTAWSPDNNTILMSEWDGVAGSATTRNPPSLPGGVGAVNGLSMTHDPVTDDIYIGFHDVTDGDFRWAKFTRATLTWGSWSIAVSATPVANDGKIQMVRHTPRDSVDMVYATGASSAWKVYYSRITSLNRTPASPTLGQPASGARQDLASGGTFFWTYNQVAPGDTQQAYAFRRTAGSTTEYWNNATQSFQSTIVWNASPVNNPTTLTFPAGVWTNGTTYTWSVAARSATGQNSTFATDRTVVATAAPVVAVIDPLGAVLEESTPIVDWTYTSADAQASYEVRIVQESPSIDPADPGPTVWGSGVVNSAIARSVQIEQPLVDGYAYRAYVRATSSTALTSAWAYSPFTIDITPPSGPAVEPATFVAATGVPRARIGVMGQSSLLTAAQDAGSGGWESDANTTVAYQDADTPSQIFQGLKLTSVASGTMRTISSLGTPPEAPYGQPQPAGPLNFPVIAGRQYTFVTSIRTASIASGRTARVKIRWFNADDGTGSQISESTGTTVGITNTFYVAASVTATAPAGAVLGRVIIEILGPTAASEIYYAAYPAFQPGSSTSWSPGGFSRTQTFLVERSSDGGATWTTVAKRARPALNQYATVDDRGGALNVPVLYRATAQADLGAGSILSSAASTPASLTVPTTLWAIRDLADDLAEMNAIVVGYERTDDESSSVHWPAGRMYPVVDTEGLHAGTGTISVYVKAADVDTFSELVQSTLPMTVQSPQGKVLTLRFIRRKYNVEDLRNRVIEISYVEVG